MNACTKFSPIEPTAYVQPLLELIHAADKLGSDFDRPEDRPSLPINALSNVRSLKLRAIMAARAVSEMIEDKINSGVGEQAYPYGPSAAAFLSELAEDLSEIERRIADRLIGYKEPQ